MGTVAVAQAGTLGVTWEDCGAQHATVTDLQPTSISTGTTETLTGAGTVDEDVTSAHFTATVKAAGVKLTSCDGDATEDITCKLPLGAGKIVVKKVAYPLAKGDVKIPVDVTTSSLIPASLAKVDVEIRAQEQNGEDVICLNVHTAKQQSFQEIAERVNALGSTWQAQAPEKFASVEDVKPFLGTILKGEEGYKAMAKEVSEVPNSRSLPSSMCALPSQIVLKCLATSVISPVVDLAGHSVPLRPLMIVIALQPEARSSSRLKTPLPIVDSSSASPWGAMVANLARHGTGSEQRCCDRWRLL